MLIVQVPSPAKLQNESIELLINFAGQALTHPMKLEIIILRAAAGLA